MIYQSAVHHGRLHHLHHGQHGPGPVLYWMSREQRCHDNWGLLYAQEQALIHQRPLLVIFCLDLAYPAANRRHFSFLLHGLQQVEEQLQQLAIPFFLLQGEPVSSLLHLSSQTRPLLLVTDFDPLRLKRQWQEELAQQAHFPIMEVDGHNIVPCRLASSKREYGAYTLRPKLRLLLEEFLIEPPALQPHPFAWTGETPPPWQPDDLLNQVSDQSVREVQWLTPGPQAGLAMLNSFCCHKLDTYDQQRNNPCLDGQSNLSPYLHFGQLSAQRVAWQVEQQRCRPEAKADFLEELIVRRELSDNFCHYEPHYDQFSAFPAWAQQSLNEHRHDTRSYLYSRQQFELGQSHEALWNFCQGQLMEKGKLHGYLRMYWAKKILEWSASPEEAQAIAIYLNDKYLLDGRDPNGYAGIAWSMGGVHDRAWPERPVFGKVRYMNENGCRRKFKVDSLIQPQLF